MKTYKGKLSIGKSHSNLEGSRVHITLQDETSHCRVVKVEISLEEFASALFSLIDRPCQYEVNLKAPIGKVFEHKQEVIFIPDHLYEYSEEVARKALSPFEVDGWKGRVEDAMNHHCWVKPKPLGGFNYNVMFFRYVRPKREKSGE